MQIKHFHNSENGNLVENRIRNCVRSALVDQQDQHLFIKFIQHSFLRDIQQLSSRNSSNSENEKAKVVVLRCCLLRRGEGLKLLVLETSAFLCVTPS